MIVRMTHGRVELSQLIADPFFLESFGVVSGPFYEWIAVSPLNLDRRHRGGAALPIERERDWPDRKRGRRGRWMPNGPRAAPARVGLERLGAALARAELQEALAALTERLECPRVGADAEWRPPVGLNGPSRLPLTFKTCT
jgi:hypothetical protein